MKNHVTVTLTKDMIRDQDPCGLGHAQALQYLPATLSTNPEENIELALRVACSSRAKQGWDDVWWLVAAYASEHTYEGYPDDDYNYRSTDPRRYRHLGRPVAEDPWVIAQYLAWVADAIATRAGK